VRSVFQKMIKAKVEKSIRPMIETFLVFLNFLGQIVIPNICIFTDYLNMFTMGLSDSWRQWLLVFGWINVIFFARIHYDLGQSWSPILEIKKDHKLITRGVYKYLRHPMYTHIWLWVIGQGFILNNSFVLISGIVFWSILYFIRVGKEEQMMLQQFGSEYKDYMMNTPRIIPFIK